MSLVSEVPVGSDGNRSTPEGSRSRRRGLRGRLTVGHVAPVVLAVFTAVFVLAGLADRSATVEIPVASAAIPAGAAVNATDTRLVRVHRSDSRLVAGLISASELGQGWVAAVRIEAGDPITRSALTQTPAGASGLGAMSLPVPADRADGGALQPGDRVDVLGSDGNGGVAYLAEGLQVLAVSPPSSGLLSATSGDYWISVAVDRATALKLAAALDAQSGGGSAVSALEVVLSSGEPPPVSSAPPGGGGAR